MKEKSTEEGVTEFKCNELTAILARVTGREQTRPACILKITEVSWKPICVGPCIYVASLVR